MIPREKRKTSWWKPGLSSAPLNWNDLRPLVGASWHTITHDGALVGNIDRDRLALWVIEPVNGVYHEQHDDPKAEDGDEKKTHDEAAPDGDREEPDAVVGTTELVELDFSDLHLSRQTNENLNAVSQVTD